MGIPKGFISVGKNAWVNIECLNIERCFISKTLNKAIIFDKFGVRYTIDKELVKGKLELNYGK